jgi:hypothetical protein
LIPVWETPWTIWRCSSKSTASSGRMPRTAEAVVSVYWIAEPPIRLLSPTGMVRDFVWVGTSSGH